MQPTGYIVLDQKLKMVMDPDVCNRLITSFRVWKETYFHTLQKRSLFGQKRISRLRSEGLDRIYEECKTRLAANQYEVTDDPALLKLNETIKKLDENVVASYELVKRRLLLLDRSLETEKSLWKDPSVEKLQTYADTLLPAMKNSNDAMLTYLKTRTNLTYELGKALREYQSTLELTKMRHILIDVLAVLAGLFSPIYGVIVKSLGEVAEMTYRDFTGYKGLLRQMRELRKMQPRIDRVLKAFHDSIDRELVRNFSSAHGQMNSMH